MAHGENELDYPAEYVAARAALLDALEALRDHLPAIILVGAQAVYLHTGSGDFVEPQMTTDADLALDATRLGAEPEITAALAKAKFKPGSNPGRWCGKGDVAVDIMVVPSQSGRTSGKARAARLPGHAASAARITPGLEPALLDHAPRTLTALDPNDQRQVSVDIAGPAALLIAKAIKVQERLAEANEGTRDRVREKDALDMLRLLQAVETADLVAGLQRHFSDADARHVTVDGLAFLREHGLTAQSRLATLATEAAGGDPTAAPSFAALAQALLEQIDEYR
jgi:hypothetical protein